MENLIVTKGETLAVVSKEYVEEFKSTSVRQTPDGEILLQLMRFFTEPGKSGIAEGYEILGKNATIYVSKEQAKKFAKQILKAVGE